MPELFFSNTPPSHVCYASQASPIGPLLIGWTRDEQKQNQICRLTFLEKRAPQTALKRWQKEWPHTLFTPNAKAPKLTDQTPILLVGSDFQHRVWAALLDIPTGKTETYGHLAARIGKPGAARAVGTALGANPVPLLIPCHRIVASTGLGGFTGGLALKQALLTFESPTVPPKAAE